MRSMLLAILIALSATSATARCVVGQLAQLPVTMAFLRPTIHAKINGQDVRLLTDSGAFFGTLSPGAAAELKLPLHPAPFGMVMKSYGGEVFPSITNVRDFVLDTIPIHDLEFVVGGSEIGPGLAGVLGRNVLNRADAEYDLANGVIRLMKPEGCGDKAMAYWADGKVFSAAPMVLQLARNPAAVIRVTVEGKAFNAVLDSGAATSFITLAAATRAGMPTSGPLISNPGQSGGFGRKTLRAFVSPAASVVIGEEEIKNTRLRVVDTQALEGDVVLGADFFLSHRIFIANSQSTVYFTFNGGPVFNLVAKPIDAPHLATPAAAETTNPVDVKSDAADPTDAAGFSRRGGAFASRRDFPAAMADIDRAVALAPDNADYVYQRAQVRLALGQVFLAMGDIEQSLKLRPGDPDALMIRAELRIMGRDRTAGLADLDTVAKTVSPAADIRLRLGGLYERLDRLDDAIAQLDLWIAAHPDDRRRPQALNGRCWSRALLGRDLDKALSDCDGAHRALPQSANILNSRGLVHLRLGHFDKAIADYNASFALQPKSAWTLYGRGLAKLKNGDAAGGKADIDAAVALDPTIAEKAALRGIKP